MTTRDEPFASGTPCWVELSSSGADRSVDFYRGVFDWEVFDSGEEFGHYRQFLVGDRPVAGCMQMEEGAGHPDAWATYISTNDIDATTALASESGGVVQVPPMEVGTLGKMAVLSDPSGATFGLWEPREFFGFSRYNEPGSVTWDEHHSRYFSTSVAFYERLFNWEIERSSDTDEFRYYQAKVDGNTVAGLSDSASFLPEGVPSNWAVYFSVTNVDDTVERARLLGGKVVQPPMDTPFGRVAELVDNSGASFKVHSP